MPYTSYYGYGSSDGLYLLLLIGVMLLGFIAQMRVNSTFNKYARVPSSAGAPAAAIAKTLLRREGSPVAITETRGRLTDHFNPKTGIVGLSEAVYHSDSVAAVAVAAHEIGHVMQYERGYMPIRIRNAILPVASIGSRAAPIIVLIGLLLANDRLAMIGVILFTAVFLFQLITLPVEFDASSRAMEMLEGAGYVSYDEAKGARRVLRAAAFTYVVAALASFVTILRYLNMINRGRRR